MSVSELRKLLKKCPADLTVMVECYGCSKGTTEYAGIDTVQNPVLINYEPVIIIRLDNL